MWPSRKGMFPQGVQVPIVEPVAGAARRRRNTRTRGRVRIISVSKAVHGSFNRFIEQGVCHGPMPENWTHLGHLEVSANVGDASRRSPTPYKRRGIAKLLACGMLLPSTRVASTPRPCRRRRKLCAGRPCVPRVSPSWPTPNCGEWGSEPLYPPCSLAERLDSPVSSPSLRRQKAAPVVL